MIMCRSYGAHSCTLRFDGLYVHHHHHPSLFYPGQNYSSPEGGACMTLRNRFKRPLHTEQIWVWSPASLGPAALPPPTASAVFLVSSQKAPPVFSQRRSDPI